MSFKWREILLLAALLTVSGFDVHSQQAILREKIKLLNDDSKEQVRSALAVYKWLDTLRVRESINELEKATENEGTRVRTRVKGLKAKFFFYWIDEGDSTYATLMKDALAEAYVLKDPYMIAEFSKSYGEMLNSIGNSALAAQYCINSLKMQQELGLQNFPAAKTFYFTTAEMLYRTMNYPEAISYYKQGFTLPDDSLSPKQYGEFKKYYTHSLNALAKSFHRIKKFDSSIYYYEKCMKYANSIHSADLFYMASDNRFDPYLELKQYDSCAKIADNLYKAGLPNDSMTLLGACIMKARIAARTNKFSESITWGLKAEQLAGQQYRLLLNPYKDLATSYEQLNQKDKALYYFKKWQGLDQANDERQKKTSGSFLEAQGEFQRAKLVFDNLSQKQQTQLLTRNIIISFILAITFFGFFIFYRKRKKMEMEKKEIEEKFHFFKTKYANSEEQLAAFQKEVSEKNHQIEVLLATQQSGSNSNSKKEVVTQVDALSKQIILTEDDWTSFKENFDTVHPGFLTNLKLTIPEITKAEIRMASLIKLNFDTKHIASMLGVSDATVKKTKYRLKKRLNLSADESLWQTVRQL